MSRKVAFLFPGQGAQAVGMGRDFAESFSAARETFEEADALLERNLSSIVFEGPEEALTETRNSQVGLYVMSLAVLRVLAEQFPTLKPAVCAGLSLGEYSALTASGRLPFDQCLPLVQSRGTFMNDACEEKAGTMAAILGLSAEVVEEMVGAVGLPDDLWAANFNCPGQTVISGTKRGVEAGMEAAKERGAKRVIPLKVHGAFHSGLMASARERLAPQIERAPFQESDIEIVMNVPGGFVRETAAIRRHLIDQVTHPVRWEQSIRALEGVDLFVEIGSGQTLAGFNRKIGVEAPTLSINKVSDLDKLGSVL